LAHWAKGAQNGGKKVHVFVTGTMNSHFFVTGQIGMKFWQKQFQSVCSIEAYYNSENVPLRGRFLLQNCHFGVDLTGLRK